MLFGPPQPAGHAAAAVSTPRRPHLPQRSSAAPGNCPLPRPPLPPSPCSLPSALSVFPTSYDLRTVAFALTRPAQYYVIVHWLQTCPCCCTFVVVCICDAARQKQNTPGKHVKYVCITCITFVYHWSNTSELFDGCTASAAATASDSLLILKASNCHFEAAESPPLLRPGKLLLLC